MNKTYIALDLETTGLDPGRDAIIEVGALRFEGERVLETFSTFVNPGRNIPPFITELTGITNADVDRAPSLRVALRDLSDFVDHAPVVGHNVGFDLTFLRQHSALVGNTAIDTFELAGILVPHASRYSLANLVTELALNLPPQTHRALDDARMAHALYIALLERATQLPQRVLQDLVQLGQRINWGPVNFFREAQHLAQRQGFSGGIGAQLAARRGGDAAGPLFEAEEDYEPLTPRHETRLLDLDALTRLFDANGPIAATFADYEQRSQQIEMLQAVGEAFNQSTHLMVEAGTGTGKSLAYLLPAIQWAVQNQQRVVISTNTINLQEQLAGKDLPTLAQKLFDFRYVVLKGRSHYMCRREFEALRRRGPRSNAEMCVLAKVLLWLPNTLDGDGDALFLPTAEEQAVWSSISSATEACDPEHCSFYQAGRCFFAVARSRAEGAHLVIVNHALMLADLAMQNRVLPDYELLIVDEAHHLERAATDAMHYSTNEPALRAVLDGLTNPHGQFPGLLDELADTAERLPARKRATLYELLTHLQDGAERVQRQLEMFFDSAERFLRENLQNEDSKYGARLRVTAKMREQPGWDELRMGWSQVSPHLASLVSGLGRLSEGLEELDDSELPTSDAFKGRLRGSLLRLMEAHTQIGQLIGEPSDNAVYWMETRTPMPVMLNTAPLHIGALLHENLFEKKRAVVLTSATLRVAGSFDYMRQRLGVQHATELAVGSPFDYRSAALLYILTDIPEPRNPGYQKLVEQTLLDLFKATQGHAMALFTAYSQLRATAQALTGPLARADITVYAQGSGGSRAQLLANFRKDDKAVLLGTRSFWEGVDVPGDALSCLVIVKLPFDVPDEPLVAARAEGYEDPFNEYMVPEAALRFTQGFGRLIRTASDQGVVVVLDQRLLTKRYGQQFLDSLPDPTVRRGTRRELPSVAASWLAGEKLPQPATAEDGAEWNVPPPEEPPWFWGA